VTANENNRLALVRQLLEISAPLEEIMKRLSMMDWEYEGDGVKLTKRHLAAALARYLRGELTVSDVENWANQIEGREDVQFEAGSEQLIGSILYEIANPTLTYPLDIVRARALLEMMGEG
jgi:hypothetical protein